MQSGGWRGGQEIPKTGRDPPQPLEQDISNDAQPTDLERPRGAGLEPGPAFAENLK
jgi:hypothetical protein